MKLLNYLQALNAVLWAVTAVAKPEMWTAWIVSLCWFIVFALDVPPRQKPHLTGCHREGCQDCDTTLPEVS